MDLENLKHRINAAILQNAEAIERQRRRAAYVMPLIPAKLKQSRNGGKNSGFDTDVADAGGVPAILPWATYGVRFRLAKDQAEVISQAASAFAVWDSVIGSRCLEASAQMARNMEVDILTGTGVDRGKEPTIQGLVTCALTTAPYAGISGIGYPEWNANILANGGVDRELTHDLLAQADDLVWVAKQWPWHALITTAGMVRKYSQLMTSSGDRFYWKGREVIRSPVMPVGTAIMLCTQGVQMNGLAHQFTDAEIDTFRKLGVADSCGRHYMNPSDAAAITPLVESVTETPNDDSALTCELSCTVAMATTSRRSHAIIRDIYEGE